MDTFLNCGKDARSTQAKHVFIITSEWEDGVIRLPWRNDGTFDQAFHTQARLYIITIIAYENDRIADAELEIPAYIGHRLMTSTY